MKKGFFCIMTCILIILGSVVPVSGTLFPPPSSPLMRQGDVQSDATEKIFSDLLLKLDTVTTKQEALVLVNQVIVELHEQGVLPKGMSIKQAQHFIMGGFSKVELTTPIQNSDENSTGNTNCLVIGFTNGTFFNPYPTIHDFPMLYNFLKNNSYDLYGIYLFFLYTYMIRISQPIKFGSYALVGYRYKLVENGYVTNEEINIPSGWVWTFGSNGIQKWNGTFYGSVYTEYIKHVFGPGPFNYEESWDPVGIRGFVGMNIFNFRSVFWDLKYPSFFIGFAREINMTYNPPWP